MTNFCKNLENDIFLKLKKKGNIISVKNYNLKELANSLPLLKVKS